MRMNDLLLIIVIKSFGIMLKLSGQDFEQKAYAKRLLKVLEWLCETRPTGLLIWDTIRVGVRAAVMGDQATMMVVGMAVMEMSLMLREESDALDRKSRAALN